MREGIPAAQNMMTRLCCGEIKKKLQYMTKDQVTTK